MMISLGFRDVAVEMEVDRIFTVIGRIDPERRCWQKQLQAARLHLIRIIGSEAGADQFVETFLGTYDDPATCSITTLLYSSRCGGSKPGCLLIAHTTSARLNGKQERALKEVKRVTRPGGIVVSCDFSGFAIEHYPVTSEFDRQVRQVTRALVDCDIGRKVKSVNRLTRKPP